MMQSKLPVEEITVVPGATEAIFCAIHACIHPGDEVYEHLVYDGKQHYLRFCFTKSDEVLEQAAEILCRI